MKARLEEIEEIIVKPLRKTFKIKVKVVKISRLKPRLVIEEGL